MKLKLDFDVYSRRQFVQKFSENMDTFYYKLVVSLFVLQSIAIFKATVDSILTVDAAACQSAFLKYPTSETSLNIPGNNASIINGISR